jgi:hypothetical protein
MKPGRKRSPSRDLALLMGEYTFVPETPCTRCGTSLRYTKGGICITCSKEASKQARAARAEKDPLA